MEIKGIHIQPTVCTIGETVTIKVQVYGKLPAKYQELKGAYFTGGYLTPYIYQKLKEEIRSRLIIIGPGRPTINKEILK